MKLWRRVCTCTPCRASNQDDGKVAGRGPGSHVAGVLLVARGVGNDELAARRREIAVCHVDGNALLALCLQAVHEQGEVNGATRGARLHTVRLDGIELVFVDHLGVVQQPADERALAVVDAAAGEQAQQFLALVLCQISVDVRADEIRLVRHRDEPGMRVLVLG